MLIFSIGDARSWIHDYAMQDHPFYLPKVWFIWRTRNQFFFGNLAASVIDSLVGISAA
jgi:hypothetical protein